MALEDNLVAIFPLDAPAPVGAGLLVELDLVLTCAHVVSAALSQGSQTGRPLGIVEVRLHTSPDRVKASVDSGHDAWSDPPATRQTGADLCLLRLDPTYKCDLKPVRLILFADLPTRKFRVAGYPKGWDVDFSLGEIVGREQHGLYVLRPEPTALALVRAQTKSGLFDGEQRPPGIIYKGFSGSPVEVEGGIAGLLTEARARVSEATAYMIPVSAFPDHVRKQARTPSGWWVEDWLASQAPEIAKRFADRIAAAALKPGSRPEELYLDLVVTERHLEKKRSSEGELEAQTGIEKIHPFDDVLIHDESPLLLIGEGGGGKTTSLLYAAARVADRAKADPAVAIPIYVDLARVTNLAKLSDLHQPIAESMHTEWGEISARGAFKCRRFLFLFDSFNEIPEHLQKDCMTFFQNFINEQGHHHMYLMASRRVPRIEQLSGPPWNFKTFEILRLTPEKVHGFLHKFSLGSLYETMPTKLRELAGNPFILLAITSVLGVTPQRVLPRNEGELYQGFVDGWMKREEEKPLRIAQYSHADFKEPILSYLAKRMTSAGQTSLAWTDVIEGEVKTQLYEAQKQVRIKRRKDMPEDWTVDACLKEILADGLLKRVNDQVHFMHQSVQEYFTTVRFRFPDALCDALVDFTPKLFWDSISAYELAQVPSHRFVTPLLMMVGLLKDSTKIVEAIAARNPVLAAAAISSAVRVDNSLVMRLERDWLGFLEHDDPRHRVVGCSCLALASRKTLRIIRHLLSMALTGDEGSLPATMALKRLNADGIIPSEIAERAMKLPDDEYAKQKWSLGTLVEELQTGRMVSALFEGWRASPPDSSVRRRFEGLLATVDKTLLTTELQRIGKGPSDPAIEADAERVLTESASWEGATLIAHAREVARLLNNYAARVAETAARMTDSSDQELVACLGSDDSVARAAAAKVAAERRIPVGDVIVELLVRKDLFVDRDELIDALVSLFGEHTTVSKLIEASRTSSGGVELYDFKGLYRAFTALVKIPGEASTIELRRAVESDNPDLQKLAIDALARRGDQSLAASLISQLSSNTSHDFIAPALSALGMLQSHEAVSLVNDLLVITRGEFSDVHPVWGSSNESTGWAVKIHDMLVRLDMDSEIRQMLDKALCSDEKMTKIAALSEFFKWFAEEDLTHDRKVGWRDPERLKRLLDLALSDPDKSVRTAAAETLGNVDSGSVLERLSTELHNVQPALRANAALALGFQKQVGSIDALFDALEDGDIEVQLAAGEALARLKVRERYGQVAEAMFQIAKSTRAKALRQRAAGVLIMVPNGTELFYPPIQSELRRGEWERALKLIEEARELVPEDVNLFWWRGLALKKSGQLKEAAESYEHASELEKQAPLITQALAETFLELGDYRRAKDAAKRGVEIAPGVADAQSILAWSSYKAGAIQEAVDASGKAVDLDPVHSDSIWIILLGHIRQSNPPESRSAFDHALRVRQLLSPGLDTSFIPTFLEELETINSDNAEVSRLIEDIKSALVPSIDQADR